MSLQQDVANYLAYVQGSGIPPETVAMALQYRNIDSSGSSQPEYSIDNYSGIIVSANVPQDLAPPDLRRHYINIQNIDDDGVLLIGIDSDAQAGRSYQIEAGGSGVVEIGEADKRISVLSSKTGLKFVAIARIRN